MSGTALRTDMVRARIDPRRKQRAEAVLEKLGIAPSQAINMLYAQIELIKGMPFEMRIPNKKTIAAMNEVRQGRAKKAKTVSEMFKDLRR